MRRSVGLVSVWFLLLAAFLLIWGCGSSGSGGVNTGDRGGEQPSSTATQVRLGDSPADSIVSFELSISSIQLTSSTGATVELLTTPVRMEMLHNSGTSEPLAIANIPQGSYTQAVFAVSNPEVTFIDSTSGQPVQAAMTLSSPTVTVTLSPTVNITGTSSVLNIDLNVANSVALSGDAATVTPSFSLSLTPINSTQQLPQSGAVEDISGQVTSVGTSSLTIQVHTGQTLTFTVDSSTSFEGVTALSQITTGMLVEVTGKTNTDGSLLATDVSAEVESEGADELEAEGIITELSGAPLSSLSILVRDSVSTSGTPPEPGLSTTVTISGSTGFEIDSGSLDLTALPFTPAFDVNNIGLAQNVEADTRFVSSTVDAETIKLKLQTLKGTISGLSGSGATTQFTLTLPSDSAFALLTGQTTIAVFSVPQTVTDNVTVVDATTLRVRGLLFFDGTSYRLVAARYTAAE